jgi:hypothetical protein
MSDSKENSQEKRDSKEESKQEAGNAENNAEENAITVSDNNDNEGGNGNSGDAPHNNTDTTIVINQEENVGNQPHPASVLMQKEVRIAVQMLGEDLQGTGEKSMSTSKSPL